MFHKCSPNKAHLVGWLWPKGAQLRQHIDATLGSGNLREAVRLPPGEDINEWLAVNTVDFFNQVNLLYGTLTEFCTPESCPTMSAGPKVQDEPFRLVFGRSEKIVSLKEEAHLNTCFKHFILFTCEFTLIDKKELVPLQELIESVVPY
ncbi:hypothetical protein OROHE_013485 [Orobanche hederae]